MFIPILDQVSINKKCPVCCIYLWIKCSPFLKKILIPSLFPYCHSSLWLQCKIAWTLSKKSLFRLRTFASPLSGYTALPQTFSELPHSHSSSLCLSCLWSHPLPTYNMEFVYFNQYCLPGTQHLAVKRHSIIICWMDE